MAQVELIMPKMGESIMEATILKWLKKVGDPVELDETILEIATDKVDSEIPSPVAGTIAKILYEENEVVEVGKTIAILATEGEEVVPEASPAIEKEEIPSTNNRKNGMNQPPAEKEKTLQMAEAIAISDMPKTSSGERFYSPLVRNIAKKENISPTELEIIQGTGLQGRVTKKDILAYVKIRIESPPVEQISARQSQPAVSPQHGIPVSSKPATSISGNVEIVEMDRMRKLIADHMVLSKQTSPHVTSFVEADVTNLVNWRNKIKGEFQEKYGEKITFTPIFVEAVVKAIKDFPMINICVDGTNILVKKDINIGMATALPSGHLIVPVIKQADEKNLLGLTKTVNDLASRARTNKLKPEDIQDGTFTLTNVGTFGNVMGTPIINQPQVAILAVGAIRKKPAVVETEYGDLIAIRQMMFLSLSYDHRVVDGFLGGSFLRKIADYLENFDANKAV